jgi:SAM-dependent methyltransferase
LYHGEIGKSLRYLFKKPPVGLVRFGSLRRRFPISHVFGYDRGSKSVARYYIDRFIEQHSNDIRGHVLEIGDNTYTVLFGGDKVTYSDVLHLQPDNSKATIVADLTCADAIAEDTFDCIVLTQTLQFIYDVRSALSHIFRILKPGGVLLATISGISQISRYDMDRWGEYWRFTTLSAQCLFTDFFPPENVTIEAHGNVLSAIALLHGLACSELKLEEMEHHDPDYEIIITVYAVKPGNRS